MRIPLKLVVAFIVIGAVGQVDPLARVSSAQSGQEHRATTIFVDADADQDGDGTARAPYRTISGAIERARQVRTQGQGRITVRVAPGSYVETAPLYIDVSNLELRGSTQLIEDADGLPANCGTDVAASPCLEPGTETVVAPAAPLATGQVLLMVGPTTGNLDGRLTDVEVRGFVLDGMAANVAASGTGLVVDRTENFSTRGNVTRRTLVAVMTRLSSGTIRGHYAHDNNDGFAIAGGSSIYPAVVEVVANRVTNNRAQGALAFGMAGVRARLNVPDLLPVQVVYDRINHPEQVPDALTIALRHNDISRNGSFGLRFEEYSANNSFYDTVDGQPMTASITAHVRDNTFTGHAEYGVTVEGAFVTRSNPRTFTGRFDGVFENNDLTGNGRAGLFAGFMLNGVVTRNPGLLTTTKYLVDSRFSLTIDAALDVLDYDNPALDPFDSTTPLNNVLTVNGVDIVGRHVTCPPGFPCAI